MTQTLDLYGRKERFPSLYVGHRYFEGVPHTIERMRIIIRVDVVKHGLVNEGYIQPYLSLVDALEMWTKALFAHCPKGVVKFELTREHGIKMLFNALGSSEGNILNALDVGWVYAGQVAEVIDKTLVRSHEVCGQIYLR